MLSNIQSALRAGISDGARRVGPFLVHLDPDDDHPFRNYAIPDDGAQPSVSDVAALVTEFRDGARMPRLEYLSPAPAVTAGLHTAGFTVENRLSVMVLSEHRLRHPGIPSGVDIHTARSDAELHDAAHVQNVAYGAGPEVSQSDVDRLRGTVDGGGNVLLARFAGEPAGAGLSVPARYGLAEVAAIGVLEPFRGKGIASALSAEASRWVFNQGATPYLQCETSNEERVYGRIGYTTVGELLAISLSL